MAAVEFIMAAPGAGPAGRGEMLFHGAVARARIDPARRPERIGAGVRDAEPQVGKGQPGAHSVMTHLA